MTYIIIVLIAYLLGSFCASIPLSKRVYGGDVREKGSGNAGATNMARVYGMKAGIATFILDAVKTAAAMLIGAAIGGEAGKALAGALYRRLVAVNADESARRKAGRYLIGMAAHAESSVEVYSGRFYIQIFNTFVQEH